MICRSTVSDFNLLPCWVCVCFPLVKMRRTLFVLCFIAISAYVFSQQNCSVSLDCTNPLEPICLNGTCSPCQLYEQECLNRSVNTPICYTNGGCYGCLDSLECYQVFSNAPICANESGACRACLVDSECAFLGALFRCDSGQCTYVNTSCFFELF
jgi:hypothetical protein